MFETLTDKLTSVLTRLGSKGRLSEADVDEALREVRLALLEADVNFRVAREVIERIRAQATGEALLRGISPGQQVVKIVHEALVELLGGENRDLAPMSSSKPNVLMLIGLTLIITRNRIPQVLARTGLSIMAAGYLAAAIGVGYLGGTGNGNDDSARSAAHSQSVDREA